MRGKIEFLHLQAIKKWSLTHFSLEKKSVFFSYPLSLLVRELYGTFNLEFTPFIGILDELVNMHFLLLKAKNYPDISNLALKTF